MSKYVLALATCAISSAFAAPDALRFQGVSATVGATPADAPTVDPSTQTAGLPVKQKLNIGEKTALSPAMQAVLCLVALYYAIQLVAYIITIKKQLREVQFAGESEDAKKEREKLDAANPDPIQAQLNKLKSIVDDAKATCDLIPMVSILIVFARLRAKVDLEGTNPPEHVRKCFFGIVGIMYTQAFFVMIFSIIGSMVSDGMIKGLTQFKALLQFLLMLALYTCIVVIFMGICTQVKTASE